MVVFHRVAVGVPADVTVLDLDRAARVDPARFRSLGRSTPFAGQALTGWPTLTIVAGRRVFEAAV